MEELAGIEADIELFFDGQDQQKSSSDGFKQVPWLSWEEWDYVRESLFSSSFDRVASALERVATWRSRGSLPAPVDVTCSLIEIQLKDGFIPRDIQSADALYSEHLLQMLYCMGILRLANCVIEKTRRRTEVSIADAAKAIGIPRKLIDLRHGSNKRIRKIVSSLVELYPSFSTEISSVLLEFLLKALDSSKSTELQNQSGQDLRVFLDEWKPVILEFSNREPELLLTLLKEVLDMIQDNERRKCETDLRLTEKSGEEIPLVEQVPFLFAWLVSLLNGSKHFQRNCSLEVKPSSTFIKELIRKCLLLGALGYELVLKSAFLLADIMEGRILKEKLIKLPLMHKSSASVSLEKSSTLLTTHTTLLEQEKNLGNACKRLEFIKLHLSLKKCNDTYKTGNRWRKAKTWSPCPIGMLPRTIGSSGRLPLLYFQNCKNISKQAQSNNNGKRRSECSGQQLEKLTCKRARQDAEDSESNDVTMETYADEAEMNTEDAYKGTESETEAEENLMLKDKEESRSCLMIGGEWKRVNYRELLGMASNVKICV